jgi:hypothetical protein
MILDTNIIAYALLSRDDIADLRAIMDADELADFLINTASTDALALIPTDLCDDDFDIFIASARSIMTSMILNPVD